MRTTVKLGDVLRKSEEKEFEPLKVGYERFVKVEHMDADNLRIQRWGSIKDDLFPPTFYKVFRKGQILFPTRNPHLRRVVVADFDGICGEKTLTLSPIENKIEPSLVAFIFQSDNFVQHCINSIIGSTNPHVRWRDIAEYKIDLPERTVQKKIAEILWSIKGHMEKTEHLMKLSERLKSGLFEELLIRGIGHTEFRKTELGEIPEEWKLVELGSVMKPNFGIRITQKSDTGSKYPVYGGGGISFYTDKFNRENEFVISRFAMSEECVRYVAGRFFMLDSGFTVEATDEIPKEYLGIFLTINQGSVYSCGRGPAQKNLDIKQFLKIPFPKPTRNESEKIIQLYHSFDNEGKALESTMRNLSLLRKKLTNSLLNGEMTITEAHDN